MASPCLDSATVFVPDHYPTIQAAIDAAAAGGDTIIVRPGVYRENIDLLGKKILVRSELGPSVTAIDGNRAGSVVSFRSGEKRSTVVDGFRITNGLAAYGGGIFCESSPRICNNLVEQNEATVYGGGLFSYDGNPEIVHNCFSDNEVSSPGGQGGGLFLAEGCTFTRGSNQWCRIRSFGTTPPRSAKRLWSEDRFCSHRPRSNTATSMAVRALSKRSSGLLRPDRRSPI